jgi:hypothetical protein
MKERVLSFLPFELAYLALLTRYGIKRLSRWEHRLSERDTSILGDLGLNVSQVERRTLFGRKTAETVFSMMGGLTRFYLSRFNGHRLASGRDDVRLQGFLFGYPSCCVEEFIRHPYSENDLRPEEQRILFHWACPGCKVTPSLLKEYRLIHSECLKAFGGREPVWDHARADENLVSMSSMLRAFQQAALPVALCLSAMFLAPKAMGASDPHLLPVADDDDSDYLSFREEVLKGVDWYNPSTAPDTLLDGVVLALEVKAVIDGLPGTPQTDCPYKAYEYQYGVETCDICGEVVNMGHILIVHPLRGLSMEVPFIAYHYLEHGSLAYMGSVHGGRLDFSLLKNILLCSDTGHRSFYDSDYDGLEYEEEVFIGTDPSDADTDGDSVQDGPQYFEGLIASLTSISRTPSDTEPYLVEMQMDGVETCDVCGNTYNMGFVQLVNPVEELTVQMPYVALHYLAHGSASYRGSENMGHLLPTVVNTALNGDGTSHWIEVEGDTDGDGLKDAEEAYFSLDPGNYDSDGDGVPDGPALAQAMHAIIEGLPREECPDSVYRIEHWARGIYTCLACGEIVNMGGIEIINPMSDDEPVWLSYINLHFMAHGSFANDRPWLVERTDPMLIDQVLGSPAYVPGKPPLPQILKVFPNPFVERTRIVCNLPRAATLRVTIHDVTGRQVEEFGPVSASKHEVFWNGTDREGRRLAPGTYVIRLDLDGITLSKKVLLLK